jgi:hypothetical protein
MSKDQIVSVGLRTFRPMACSEPLARSTPHICKSPVLAPPSADCVSGQYTSSNWNCLVSVSKLVLRNPTPSRLSCPVLAQNGHSSVAVQCTAIGSKADITLICRHVRFSNRPVGVACVIHNADARLLDRYVQSSKMVHAALLLLMLEAVTADLVFTISLKRSTQNLQLSTTSPADYPIF